MDEEPTLRERKKQQTRELIHRAARELVAERGLEETSVAEICAAAQISNRTFFNYYSSKAAAALGLFDLRISPEQRRRFLAADGPLVDDLCSLVTESFLAAGAARARRGGPGKSGVVELVRRRPELVPELIHGFIESRRQFVRLAAERADARQAGLAGTLVLSAVVYTVQSDPEFDETRFAQRVRQNLADMAVLAVGTLPGDDG